MMKSISYLRRLISYPLLVVGRLSVLCCLFHRTAGQRIFLADQGIYLPVLYAKLCGLSYKPSFWWAFSSLELCFTARSLRQLILPKTIKMYHLFNGMMPAVVVCFSYGAGAAK